MLLKKSIGSFRYTPFYGGNRELPDGERVSVLIRPVTRLEAMAQAKWSDPDELTAWRERELAECIKTKEYGPLIEQLPVNLQCALRQFQGHVSEIINAAVEDDNGAMRKIEDPVELFLEMVGEDWEGAQERIGRTGDSGGFESAEDAAECGLIAEIQYVLSQTATLKGDELKNFASLCASSSSRRSATAPDATDTDDSATVEPSA
jgi:hypothetical protein